VKTAPPHLIPPYERTDKMKHALATLSLLILCSPAYAQSNATSDSASNAQVGVSTGAQASIFEDNRSYGSTMDGDNDGVYRAEIRNVPDAVAPSMGSGHPCALGRSASVAVVGFGASGGLANVDAACMLMRSNNRNYQRAAMLTYASKDMDLCRSLQAVGEVSDCIKNEKERPVAAIKPRTRPIKVALTVSCVRNGNRITPQVSRAVAQAYTAEQIMDACR